MEKNVHNKNVYSPLLSLKTVIQKHKQKNQRENTNTESTGK